MGGYHDASLQVIGRINYIDHLRIFAMVIADTVSGRRSICIRDHY